MTAAPMLPEAAATDVCPGCQGHGLTVARLIATAGGETPVWETCWACDGSGVAPAEAVVFCASCEAACWADQVCRHAAEDALCRDCAPRGCPDCIDERSDR